MQFFSFLFTPNQQTIQSFCTINYNAILLLLYNQCHTAINAALLLMMIIVDIAFLNYSLCSTPTPFFPDISYFVFLYFYFQHCPWPFWCSIFYVSSLLVSVAVILISKTPQKTLGLGIYGYQKQEVTIPKTGSIYHMHYFC